MSATPIAEQTTLANVAPLSVALRNTSLTLILTVGALALSGFIWREQGYEMLIVTMGWPHVILGFVFSFGRVMRGEANARSAFLSLALLTGAFWVIHYNYSLTGLIYLYFLYHAFRDEIFVFLRTRERHRGVTNVYAIAGIGPLLVLLLLIPQQKVFRHDLRRTESSGAQIARDANWTLVAFKPVPNSRGREFYFYLEAPQTVGLRAFLTSATAAESRDDGRALVGDRAWSQGADLVFRPHYATEQQATTDSSHWATGDVSVLLTGGHRVGQIFTAEHDLLAGVWLPIRRAEDSAEATTFSFHLASPPLLPHAPWVENLRLLLLAALALVVLWKLVPRRGRQNHLWICLLVLTAGLFGMQTLLKGANNAGYSFPLIFQLVVVFHYWSWYVFSYDKLRAFPGPGPSPTLGSRYDGMLTWLRGQSNFTTVVLVMNLVSGLAVLWYYKLGGPLALRFAFDYNYFLYFLVLHVTFSFSPTPRTKSIAAPA